MPVFLLPFPYSAHCRVPPKMSSDSFAICVKNHPALSAGCAVFIGENEQLPHISLATAAAVLRLLLCCPPRRWCPRSFARPSISSCTPDVSTHYCLCQQRSACTPVPSASCGESPLADSIPDSDDPRLHRHSVSRVCAYTATVFSTLYASILGLERSTETDRII